jgi:hypothetical protein
MGVWRIVLRRRWHWVMRIAPSCQRTVKLRRVIARSGDPSPDHVVCHPVLTQQRRLGSLNDEVH